MTGSRRVDALKALAVSVVVLAIWAVFASRRPMLTYHFAPLIAVAAGPWLVRTSAGERPFVDALRVTTPPLAATLLAAVALHAADRLQGPTFWSDTGALGEALLFASIGAAISTIALTDRRKVVSP